MSEALQELEALCARVVDGARADEQVEAFAVHRIGTSVEVFERDVENLAFAESRGIGVRLFAGNRLGFASTSDVSPDGLNYALSEARANANFTTADDGNVLPEFAEADPLDGIYVAGFDEVTNEARIALALDLERRALAADDRISAVPSASYGDALTRVAIASTQGVRSSYERTDVHASVSVLAGSGDETQSGWSVTAGRSVNELDIMFTAHEAAMRATRMLGARKPQTARVPIVFDQLVTAQFLGIVIGALSADAAQKGRSLFAEQLGQQIAAETISIVDDGRLLDGLAASPFDDEGVPSQRTPVVSNGVLQTFLYNTETATRAGVRSTGNAARGGYGTPPTASASNAYFEAPAVPVTDLLRQAEGALFVQDISGVHSGVNSISGDFSVAANGLWIRGGELAEPVREITISATIPEMLRGIVAIGDDRRFFAFGGALAGATMLLAQMTAAGT